MYPFLCPFIGLGLFTCAASDGAGVEATWKAEEALGFVKKPERNRIKNMVSFVSAEIKCVNQFKRC